MDRRAVMAKFAATLAAASTLPAAPAFAQAKPIRIIVPFAAGGPIDVTVRLLAEKVRDKIEVPVDADEERCLELARASESVRRAIGDKVIAKEIVRAPRLVNVVTAR